ncbi:MAG: transcription initiation factor TFIIIB [Candidatus Nanosalina sp. J07AB43]|jgi:Transcription initiation factor TFIIIB, Brf1 subunit/Transcription initiation factor TFIIB|nr:MAG: transcription initiation factor TFIIIB [Candidatus Nanosalina sp. J07AB43]
MTNRIQINRSPRQKAHRQFRQGVEENPLGDPRPTSVDFYSTPENYGHALIDAAYLTGYVGGKAPKTIAASAYYAASLMFNVKRTHEDVKDVFGNSRQVVSNNYENMIRLLSEHEIE